MGPTHINLSLNI